MKAHNECNYESLWVQFDNPHGGIKGGFINVVCKYITENITGLETFHRGWALKNSTF